MPVVEVKMWPGRTAEQKVKIIAGVTKVFEELGVPKEQTTVVITEVDKSNWGWSGESAEALAKKKQ